MKKNRGLQISLKYVFSESPYQNELSGKFSENLDTPSLIGIGLKKVLRAFFSTLSDNDIFN
jgi:hypothetical protein